MTGELQLGTDFALPRDAVTQKLAWIGRTGSGKTYGATKAAELMLDAGAQIVALDPAGVWYGLRVATRGHAGFNIPVFGGTYGDVPLEPTGGALIADLIVDRGISAVIDVSLFEHDTDKARFATAFARRFFFRKKTHRSAVHLFLEEAQEFVPQNPLGKDEPFMLGAFNRLIKLGRNFGIGASLISQRPQEVNKKALNMSGILFAFQMTAPHERKAILEWVHDKGLDVDIVAILPKLKVGHAHVWAPELDVSREVLIAKKWTADVSSTPEVGVTSTQDRKLTPVDLARIRDDMAATIERAKADDPAELRKQIAELRRQLAAKPKDAPAAPTERIEVSVLTAADLMALREAAGDLEAAARLVAAQSTTLDTFRGELQRSMGRAEEVARIITERLAVRRAGGVAQVARAADFDSARGRSNRPAPASMNGDAPKVDKCARGILAVLAQYPDGCTSGRLTLLSGYRFSGGFKNSLSALRGAGFMDGGNTETMRITAAGIEAADTLGLVKAPLEGAALRDYWLTHPSLDKCSRALLGALVSASSGGATADELCAATGYAYSGGFKNSLSDLRTAGLLVGKNTERMRATEDLLA